MRARFVAFVTSTHLPFAQACARFGLSRKTGYKWLNRFRAEGADGLLERDRAPRQHPERTPAAVEALVVALSAEHPDWTGGRLRRELARRGVEPVPAWTTVQAIQRRAERRPQSGVDGGGSGAPDGDKARSRLAPNDRWILLAGPSVVSGGLYHRAWVLRDEATGFVLAADVVLEQGEEGCRQLLWAAFARHGLPRCLVWPGGPDADPAAGTESGVSCAAEAESEHAIVRHTPLTVALLRQGLAVEWGGVPVPVAAPAHPDPAAIALAGRLRGLPRLATGSTLQRLLDDARAPAVPVVRQPQEGLARWRARLAAWADQLNHPTPVIADGRPSPATRYRPSKRQLGGAAPAGGDPGGQSRRISEKGVLQYRGTKWLLGRPFAGETVELWPLTEPGLVRVDFAGQPLGLLCVDGPENPAEDGRASRRLRRLEAMGPGRIESSVT